MDCIDTTHKMVTLMAANSPVRCVIFHPTCHILSQMFVQSNLDYPDHLIIWTFFSGPNFFKNIN